MGQLGKWREIWGPSAQLLSELESQSAEPIPAPRPAWVPRLSAQTVKIPPLRIPGSGGGKVRRAETKGDSPHPTVGIDPALLGPKDMESAKLDTPRDLDRGRRSKGPQILPWAAGYFYPRSEGDARRLAPPSPCPTPLSGLWGQWPPAGGEMFL